MWFWCPSARSSAIVVHCWPSQVTVSRSSSQIGQLAGGRSVGAYWTPQRRQMNASMVGLLPADGTASRRCPAAQSDERHASTPPAYNRGCLVATRPREYGRGRSMADVEITIRNNGPYSVSGPIKLVDADGNPVD